MWKFPFERALRDQVLPTQRHRSVAALAFEMAIGERQFHQHFALVITNDEPVVLVAPLAAGEEAAGTAAGGCDRAIGRAGRAAEGHDAGAAAGDGKLPLSGDIDGRRRRLWWRRSGRRRGHLIGPAAEPLGTRAAAQPRENGDENEKYGGGFYSARAM